MAINISSSQDSMLEQVTSLVFRGFPDSALQVLEKSELSEGQKGKIKTILTQPHGDYTSENAQAMKQRLVAVIRGEDVHPAAPNQQPSSSQTAQIVPSEQEGYVTFSDASTSPFANAYPCTLELGGKYYQNATACFLAQQYIDQPEVMNLFTSLDSDEATVLAELTPLTKESQPSWENPQSEHKDTVLMHVQRAKFGQNPELKKQLQATGETYLVCQGNGFYLSDNWDGRGQNTLGNSLMRLRGEYGGKGQVVAPATYQRTTQGLQARCSTITSELFPDIMNLLFKACLSQCDLKTTTGLSCINKYWKKCTIGFFAGCDLAQMCPELTILDAKAQGRECDDETEIPKFELFQWVKKLAPHVEGNAGVTLLTMIKGTTLNQLIEIAKKEGITVDLSSDRIIEELGDVPVEQTYRILVTNSVFIKSRNKPVDAQKVIVEGHGCEMPIAQEYVSLCVNTAKIFKKCLYGQNPWTYGRSSTRVGGLSLVIGGSALGRLDVSDFDFGGEDGGSGGQRRV